MILWITLGAVAFLAIAVLLTSFICFYRIFYADRKKEAQNKEEYPIPDGEVYLPHKDNMIAWMKEVRAMPHTDVSITSFDGLTLRGRYYENEKGAPIELMMHGYRGESERDLSGGVLRCRAVGHNALLVDHRAAGKSEGSVITFGVNESRDCVDWIRFIIQNIDKDAKIILTGVSMGAATVMITAAKELPENVIGVLADCGYTSAKAIIKKVIREMKLPANLLYPFARLGGMIFGGFDVDSESPIEAMKKCRLPVIFFHGDDDAFVPHSMSVENYEACITEKRMVTIEGAGHGLAFPINQEKYIYEMQDFFSPMKK
ncbi:MAG: alpha/beta hydrolase [Clostridia bacterium]|nr:alpha/beta hydrolase [Clostridia bacterium]